MRAVLPLTLRLRLKLGKSLQAPRITAVDVASAMLAPRTPSAEATFTALDCDSTAHEGDRGVGFCQNGSFDGPTAAGGSPATLSAGSGCCKQPWGHTSRRTLFLADCAGGAALQAQSFEDRVHLKRGDRYAIGSRRSRTHFGDVPQFRIGCCGRLALGSCDISSNGGTLLADVHQLLFCHRKQPRSSLRSLMPTILC